MQSEIEITPELISFFNESIKAIQYPIYQGHAVMGEIGDGDYLDRVKLSLRGKKFVMANDGEKWIYSPSFVLEIFEASGGDTKWLDRFLMPME